MSILAFQMPDKVVMEKADDFQGLFEFKPLEKGYGITIGNALRRILLSSLEGYAITGIKIPGVVHEFSSIEGVVEDVSEIILNLKTVRFKKVVDELEAKTVVNIPLKGVTEFNAGIIGNYTNDFEILNPDFVICTLDAKADVELEITIEKGRGYLPAEENKPSEQIFGFIPIDAIFTPIKNVKYSIENTRVEQKTDYEKLIFDVTTDGSIDPKDALTEASKILIHHFMLFSDDRISLEDEETASENEYDEESLKMRQLLHSKLTEMDLSVRALNCLKAAEVETLGDLVTFNKSDLMKFRNFGKKSLTELDELVAVKGLTFGMDTSKYKLDKE